MKRLVLIGGGHAHVKVLAALATRPLAGWDVHLVSPYRRQIYSGMLPGWIARSYPLEACAIALDAMVDRAGLAFHEAAVSSLDASSRVLHCTDGHELRYDALSINAGHVPAFEAIPGSACHALPVKPIEPFIEAWPILVDRILGQCRRFDLLIVGAGAAGVELAFAAQRRAAVDGWSHFRVTVLGAEALPLPGAPMAMRQRVGRLFAQHGIGWKGGLRVRAMTTQAAQLEDGSVLDFDACWMATGAAAPAWTGTSGLLTDERGFIRVDRSLRSVSHPEVFAAGDIAAYADPRPKSGVYAVRAGPVLAENLAAHCEGRPLRSWASQSRALYLLSTADHRALATWGRWTWGGRWVWRWKDRIDRRFMRRFGASA